MEPTHDPYLKHQTCRIAEWQGQPRLPSTIHRWTRRLPRLFLNSVIEGAPFAIRQLPGMATFSRMMLTMVIGIALHNIVVTAAWAKQGVTSSLRWLPRIAIFPLGLQFTSSKTIETGGGGLGIVVATVRASFAATIRIGELLGVEPTLAQERRMKPYALLWNPVTAPLRFRIW